MSVYCILTLSKLKSRLNPDFRRLGWGVLLFLVAVGQPLTLFSDTTASALDIVEASRYAEFSIEGPERQFASMRLLEVKDAPGPVSPVLQFNVARDEVTPTGMQAVMSNKVAIQSQDVLWVHFSMRTTKSPLESGEGKVQFVVENRTSFEKSAQFTISAANQWKEFSFPFVARETYAPGAARIIFRLGYQRQTVEIAGFELKNFQRTATVAELPTTKMEFRYDGMAPTAAWREAAQARIEKMRKAPLTVIVVDEKGNPVPDAQVEVNLTKHAYYFGSAVNAKRIANPSADLAQSYRELLLKNFNIVTFENDMKWTQWNQDPETALEAAKWCQDNGLILRGHNMVWPSWKKLPRQLKTLAGNPGQLRQEVMSHIKEIGARVGDLAEIWDVVNEPYNNHDLMDILGMDFLADCFTQARGSTPAAKLYLNDFGIVTGNGVDFKHQENFEQNIRFLIGKKAPLDGIGIQGHFGQELTPPDQILKILDRFGKYHLPIQMTEFSLTLDSRQESAIYMRDVMTVFFSHPATNGFILWWFQDGSSNERHSAALYDAAGNLTPCGETWKDLITRQWSTHETRATDSIGQAQFRAFHGQYAITVRTAQKEIQRTVNLAPEGAVLRISLQTQITSQP